MLRITFLGTSAARPTVRRNVTALSVQREGDSFLIDCGEGTQRQMMRFATGFSVDAVFVTHTHADHILGLPGLLRTMALQGRTDAISIFGPTGSGKTLDAAVRMGVERLAFPVTVTEVEPDVPIERTDYHILPFAVTHGRNALGYAVVEDERLGRFDIERARTLGVPHGPLLGRLHRGETVEFDGRTVSPDELVGPPRPGRRLVFSGDTAPCAATIEAARGADLLIHEATFTEEERDRAKETNHSTALQAGQVAAAAGASRLVLTHLSARYSDDPSPLREEARQAFEASEVAHDGLTIDIAFSEDSSG